MLNLSEEGWKGVPHPTQSTIQQTEHTYLLPLMTPVMPFDKEIRPGNEPMKAILAAYL